MKKMLKKLLSLTMVIVLVFTMASCGSGGKTVNLTETVKPSAEYFVPGGICPTGEYESLRAMAMEIFKSTSQASEEENLLISPVSIMLALAMTAQGAEAETLAQFEEVFGKDAAMTAALLDAYSESITSGKETAKVNVANSVWLRDDEERLDVSIDFLGKVKLMDAEIFSAPFDNGTLKDINKWVKKNTDGMIDSILEKIPDTAVMYLVNAMSFDNEWEHIYESYQVRDGQFTTAGGQVQDAEFMYSSERTFLKDDKATGFIKPYKDGFSFVAILPDEGVSVSEYIAGMDGQTLDNLIEGGAEAQSVQTGLPKFTNEVSLDLIPVLQAMGLTEMFDMANADFGAMVTSQNGNVFINKVAHKAFIEVDSKGTRAAAVTIVSPGDGAAAIIESVILNRPFIYMIVDDSANERLALFMGTVETIG